MKSGSPIPIWFSHEDRARVQRAAALAGYQHLSKYIRDSVLGRGDAGHGGGAVTWADRQQTSEQLADLQQVQREMQMLLALVLGLACKRATAAEVADLVLACEGARAASDVLHGMAPEFAGVLIGLGGTA